MFFSAILNFKYVLLEALAVAVVANEANVGHEVHVDFHETFAFAGSAAAAVHVEGKVGRREVAAREAGCCARRRRIRRTS